MLENICITALRRIVPVYVEGEMNIHVQGIKMFENVLNVQSLCNNSATYTNYCLMSNDNGTLDV